MDSSDSDMDANASNFSSHVNNLGRPSQRRVDDQQTRPPIPKPRTIFFTAGRNLAADETNTVFGRSHSAVSNLTGRVENRVVDEVVGNMKNLQFRIDLCKECFKPILHDSDGVKCSRNPIDRVDDRMEDLTINDHNDFHRLCKDCVHIVASKAIRKNRTFAGNGVGVKCLDPLCPRIFLVSEMRHFLWPEIENQLQDRILQQSMEAYCRENPSNHFYKCTMCDLPDLVDDSIRFHHCQRCQTYRCWICNRIATKAHYIRSCEEMDQAEVCPSVRFTYYNNQMLQPPQCG
uniref:IBR domain-containing protein n=1 Tax=Panagrolaimus sp. ES5 TaxID=591445 RepID=A0AC34GYT4_9BILA